MAIHISKNEDMERRSNAVDNELVTGEPAKLITYEFRGSDLTFEVGRLEKYESRYMRETIKVTESRDSEMQYMVTT